LSVRTIGLVSGAGADGLEDALALDAFLTGEPAERSMAPRSACRARRS
jgi:hypothetical protein